MKKWAFRAVIAALSLALAAAVAVILDDKYDHQTLVNRAKSDELETIKPDWTGNAVDQRDRFMDEHDPYIPSLMKLLKWRFGDDPLKDARRGDTWQVEVRDPREFLTSGHDGILWLGHASFYIRLGGRAFLLDPVFGDPRFMTRMVPVPSQLGAIDKVDYVLLSHDHRDHMDENSVRIIGHKFPMATFLAGLRSEDVLKDWTTPSNRVMTAGWFQKFDLRDDTVTVYFLPAKHWSRRGLLDTNWRLWGSYIIQAGGKTIYFGGDSAYSEYYREIGELFPRIDYFIVGIGAYEPRWFMKPIHGNPEEAVKAFVDAKAGVLIPMHYGTFHLSDEPAGQPLRDLREAARTAGVEDNLHPLAINEALIIE